MHAFDGAQEVSAASKTPPAVTGGFHEVPAFKPVLLIAGWSVTSEISSIDLETEKLQPVLETLNRNVIATDREFVPAALQASTQPP